MSPCWWRRSWSASDLKGPATGRPTGWSWDRRKDADGRTEGTAAEHQSNGYSYILCRRRHGNDSVRDAGAGPCITNPGGAPGLGGSRVWKRGFERPAFESASGRDRAGFLRAAAGADSASMPESGQNEGGVSIL